MGLHVSRICEETGLAYDQKTRTFWGTMQGYPVFLQHIPRRNTLVFRLIADSPENGADAFRAKLEGYRMGHPGISALQYQDRCLACLLSVASKESDLAAVSAITSLIALAADEYMTPCCMSCGAPYHWKQYLLDGSGVTVCAPCKMHLEEKMQDAQAEKEKQPVRRLGIVLGALLGAGVLFVMMCLVLDVRVVSFLLAYAGVALTFFLMMKFGKKLTVPAVVLGTAMCLLAGFSASALHYAGVIADNNREKQETEQQLAEQADELLAAFDALTDEQQQTVLQDKESPFHREELEQQKHTVTMMLENQTLSDCLLHLPALLKLDVYDQTRAECTRNVSVTVLTVLISAVITAQPMLRQSSGKHSLRELTV